MPTKIEWADERWNPITGCAKVSEGCRNCYAERNFSRVYPGRDFNDVRFHTDRIDQPLRWRRPRKVFVCSMGDLFHEDVLDSQISLALAIMAGCPNHQFQVLTKRPVRMQDHIVRLERTGDPQFILATMLYRVQRNYPRTIDLQREWPLPNVWLGVTAEDQETADQRIPVLLNTPAAIRFVSAEPLLGPIDFSAHGGIHCPDAKGLIDWIIVGGESGPNARPMHPAWPLSIRDQCREAGVPFFFKQWGEYGPAKHLPNEKMIRVGKKKAGRELDGRTWEEYPVPPGSEERDG